MRWEKNWRKSVCSLETGTEGNRRSQQEVTAGGLPQSGTETAGLGLQERRERRSLVVSLPASLARGNCGFN